MGKSGGADMKEIQEVLGHPTIGLTSDTSTSVLPSVDDGRLGTRSGRCLAAFGC
jgi:hypothetical protein